MLLQETLTKYLRTFLYIDLCKLFWTGSSGSLNRNCIYFWTHQAENNHEHRNSITLASFFPNNYSEHWRRKPRNIHTAFYSPHYQHFKIIIKKLSVRSHNTVCKILSTKMNLIWYGVFDAPGFCGMLDKKRQK